MFPSDSTAALVAARRVRAYRLLGSAGMAATWTLATAAAWAQPAAVIEVRPGDTFSAIAAQFTSGVSGWRKMYRPDMSGLANPDLITPGMRSKTPTLCWCG